LLHYALEKVLGAHIKQAGSLVDENRIRFDFNHHKGLTKEELERIERFVNEKIEENIPLSFYELSYDDARKRNDIKQFFGDKYGSIVRVVDIDFSKELCGGMHTSKTGNIGLFRLIKESSVAQGVRRIEAVSGSKALEWTYEKEGLLEKSAALLGVSEAMVPQKLEQLLEEKSALERELKKQKQQQLNTLAASFVKTPVKEVQCIIEEVSGEISLLDLSKCIEADIVVLYSFSEGKSALLVKVAGPFQTRYPASGLIKELSSLIGGGGGGQKELAQAGGKLKTSLQALHEKVSAWI
jgi:alanyl-tRNA synthetase